MRVLRGRLAALLLLAAAGCSDDAPIAPAAPVRLETAAIDERLAAGDLAGAQVLAEAAIAAASRERRQDPLPLAAAVEALGLRFYDSGTPDAPRAAEALLRRALELRERAPDREPAARASLLHDLSGLCFNRGAYAPAEDFERGALELRERVLAPNDPLLAQSRRDLGMIFLLQGRLADAEPYLAGSLRALEAAASPDPLEIAQGTNFLAELYRQHGRQADAATLLERFLETAPGRLGADHPLVAQLTNNLAGVYRDQERFAEAETLLHRSLSLRESAAERDELAVANAKLNLAELYRMQGKLEDAAPLYREALERARTVLGEQSVELFEFLNQLAVLERERGRLAEAETLTRRALALVARDLGPDHPRVAQSELDLAELLRAEESCSRAAEHYDRAVAARERVLGPGHPEVAVARLGRTRCLAAIPAKRAQALEELGTILDILERSESSPGARLDALALRAELLRSSDPARAAKDLDTGLDLIEQLRPHRGGGEGVRAEFLGRHIELFERAVRWAIEDGDVERALAIAERARARALLDQLAAARVADEPADPGLRARLDTVRGEIAEIRLRAAFVGAQGELVASERSHQLGELEDRRTRAVRELRAFYDEARNASPAWRAARRESAPTARALQRALVPPRTLLLIYEIGAETSHVFVVPPPPAGIEALPLRVSAREAKALRIAAGALDQSGLARVLLGRNGDGLLGAFTAPAASRTRGIGAVGAEGAAVFEQLHALRRVLVPAALEPRLREAGEVVLVPDGPLVLLPFEALIVEPGPDSASTRFWLDEGPPLRYAPSATLLVELARRPAPSSSGAPRVLSVSNPEYGRAGDLPPLPGTAAESRAVVAAFGDRARVTVLEGTRASEAELRRRIGGQRWLHLAAHGLVDSSTSELHAALALAAPSSTRPRGEDDGRLELYEVYELRLESELAVLSACRSNAGRQVTGEGVFALSRGFLVAGARRVVASQWSVDDASTAELVGELFRLVAAGERAGTVPAYAAALRDAKRRVRQNPDWSHPFFWAPFVLIGPA